MYRMLLFTGGLLLSAVLAIVLYQWARLQSLRRRASIADVGAWLGTLLRSFAPGSIVIAEPNGKAGFIQFALTNRGPTSRVIEFGLPQADWSRSAISDIKAVLTSAEVAWSVEVSPPAGGVDSFLRAEIHGAPADVYARVRRLLPALAIALGHPEHQTYRVQLLGREAAEYAGELADALEKLPNAGRWEKKVAGAIRGSRAKDRRTDH